MRAARPYAGRRPLTILPRLLQAAPPPVVRVFALDCLDLDESRLGASTNSDYVKSHLLMVC